MKNQFPISDSLLTQKLQSILNNCPDPALIADPDSFRLVKWNTELEALLQGGDCLLHKNILYIVEQLKCRTENFNQKLSDLVSGTLLEQELFLPRIDGGSLQLSIHLHKLPETNVISAIVVIIRQLQHEMTEAHTMLCFYKTLLDTISEGALLLKGNLGTIISGNNKAWQIFEKNEAALIGKDLLAMNWEIIKEDGALLLPQEYLIANILQRKATLTDQIIGLKAPSGKTIWLKGNATPLKGQGNTTGDYAVITFSDITNEKEAEQKAKQAESIFYSFLEQSITLTWVSDEDGRMLFLNELARKTWKINKDYRLKTIHELWPPSIADMFLQSDRYVLSLGEPLIFYGPSPRSDGSTGHYLVHKFLLDTGSPKKLIAGQAIDITEEKNAQADLQKSNERFSLIVKAISECVWDWDMISGQLYRSESLATLTGYSLDALKNGLGWWYSKVHADDQERVKSNVEACFKQKVEHWQDEYRFLCADNQYRYFADKGIILYEGGKPIRAIGVIQDITERKELQDEIISLEVKKQKEISQAIIVAQDHERNELSTELHDNVNQILISSALILDYACQSRDEHRADFIIKSKSYIQLAIEELRRISRNLNTSVIKVTGLRQPVEDLICNLKLSNQFTITFNYDDALEHILSGETKLALYRIIQEQTNNIVKYANATEVRISIRKIGGSIYLCTSDNGQGFDATIRKKGIGLTNMRTRVEALNGAVKIHSAPGKGCFIKIMIPLISH